MVPFDHTRSLTERPSCLATLKKYLNSVITCHKRSCGKVMFSYMFVCSQGEVLPSHNAIGQVDPPQKADLSDTVNRRAVRILRECILVLYFICGLKLRTKHQQMSNHDMTSFLIG